MGPSTLNQYIPGYHFTSHNDGSIRANAMPQVKRARYLQPEDLVEDGDIATWDFGDSTEEPFDTDFSGSATLDAVNASSLLDESGNPTIVDPKKRKYETTVRTFVLGRTVCSFLLLPD